MKAFIDRRLVVSWQAAVLAVLVLFSHVSVALADLSTQAQAVIDAADLRTTDVGVYIYDLDANNILVSINPDEPLMPASNMKVFTTAAALQTLGPDFVFRTELKMLPANSIKDVAGPVLLIKGDGDPAFGDADVLAKHGLDIEKMLEAWVNAVKATGVKQFDQLLIDDRVFDRNFVHPSWPVDQLNQWYCAEVAGLSFNDNCMDVYPEPTVEGQSPRVLIWPLVPSVNITNRAMTGKSDTFWVARKRDSNDLTFYGKVKNRRSSPINVTIHDPSLFFGELVKHRLSQAGIVVKEVLRPEDDAQLPRGQTLHVIQTTIDQVLDRCNKDSQNLFAECLFKRMGRKVTGRPGSWDNGAAALRIFLHDRLGARSAAISIADGSGMSRDNQITARSMVEVLASMASDPKMSAIFLNSLSVGGKDGTLRKRFGDFKQGTVLGKSGYIRSVSTLSGLVIVNDPTRPDGKRTVIFSLLFNNFKPPVYLNRVRETQDKLVEMIYKSMLEAVQPAAAAAAIAR